MNSYDADVRDVGPGLLESVWRYKFIVAALALTGALAGLGFALLQEPVYQAEARLLMSHPRTTGIFGEMRSGIGDMTDYAQNQAEFIRTGAVYPAAAELIGRYSPSEIAERVTLPEPPNDGPAMILIQAQDVTPEGAAELADAVAEAYQVVVTEEISEATDQAIEELEKRNAVLRERLTQIGSAVGPEGVNPADTAEQSAIAQQITANESRVQQLLVDGALFGSGVEVAQPAAIPRAPIQPNPKRSAPVGLLSGLVAAAALAWWRNSLYQVAAQSSDPAAVLQAPLLGEIPSFAKVGVPGQLPSVDAPRSMAAEAYQFVAASLMFALDEIEGRAILVTSARPDDGKTVSAANIAVAARRDGREVVVVDADKRLEGLSDLLRVDVASRFTLLNGKDAGSTEGEAVSSDWSTTRLELAPDVDLTFAKFGLDADDPASYFRTTTFRRDLSHLREFGGLIILDTPPLLAVSDTSAIASQVDGILLVVDRGTPMKVLEEVRRRLDLIGTPLLGYVFNRANVRLSDYRYGSGYAARGKKRARSHRGAASWEIPPTAKGLTPTALSRTFERDR